VNVPVSQSHREASSIRREEGENGVEVRVKRAFRGFELDVDFRAGSQRTVLFGPSGAGKTLTLKAIAGIFPPASGRIVVDGMVLYDSDRGVNLAPRARRIGYVPQRYALFPHMAVRENVGYGLHRLSVEERDERVRQMLDLTGLQGLELRRPRELSGGQQQRVALARALAFQPRMLLLDEPLSSLDAPLRAELREELLALTKRTATAMIVVTHDLAEAFSLGQWIVVIDEGRVLQEGSKDEVFYKPATRRVAKMVGIRNVLPAKVVAVAGSSAELVWGGARLTATTDPGRLHPQQEVDVYIRPTQIMIRRPAGTTFSERPNVLAGTIVEEVINTDAYRLHVRVSGSNNRSDLEIDLPAYTYFRLGLDLNKEIRMSIRPEHVHFIARR
jgi:molybdate transport system ATP-binding protein